MKKRKITGYILYIVSSFVIVALATLVGYIEEEEMELQSLKEKELVFVVDMPKQHNIHRLVTGYNYALLKGFAEHLGSQAVILNNYSDTVSYRDSLMADIVDLIVLPYSDSIENDSIYISRPLDSLTVWAVKSSEPIIVAEMEEWLDMLEREDTVIVDKSLYMNRFSPTRRASLGWTLKQLSPYDDIIKKYAKTLGWDWRLLAAVVYHESRFHIEANSRRGAKGLMQMMPQTAKRYDVSNLFDPEESIRAGSAYLKMLEKIFCEYAGNDLDLCKFTLAAYNAGEGRLMDCITFANYMGGNSSTWEGLKTVIPLMREDEILEIEAVKLGKFRGDETMKYVDEVISIYNAFCKICP